MSRSSAWLDVPHRDRAGVQAEGGASSGCAALGLADYLAGRGGLRLGVEIEQLTVHRLQYLKRFVIQPRRERHSPPSRAD